MFLLTIGSPTCRGTYFEKKNQINPRNYQKNFPTLGSGSIFPGFLVNICPLPNPDFFSRILGSKGLLASRLATAPVLRS